MGCHTWGYNKWEGVSREEGIRNIKLRISAECDFCERLKNHRETIDADLLETYTEWTPEYAIEKIKYWEDLRNKLDEMTDTEIFNMYLRMDLLDEVVDYVEGKGWYKEVEGFWDPFRHLNFSEAQLFSLQETLDFMHDPKNQCIVYDYSYDQVNEFWEKYPDGMIDFG